MPELQPIHRPAVSRKMIGIAVIVALVVWAVLGVLDVFNANVPKAVRVLFAIGGLLIGAFGITQLRYRKSKIQAAKQTRDSVLKHVWEERHHREW